MISAPKMMKNKFGSTSRLPKINFATTSGIAFRGVRLTTWSQPGRSDLTISPALNCLKNVGSHGKNPRIGMS